LKKIGLLTIIVGLVVVVLISFSPLFSKSIPSDEESVSKFISKTVSNRLENVEKSNVHMDNFLRIFDTSKYVSTFHIENSNTSVRTGHLIFETENRNRLKPISSLLQFTSKTSGFYVLNTKSGKVGLLYGDKGNDFTRANVSYDSPDGEKVFSKDIPIPNDKYYIVLEKLEENMDFTELFGPRILHSHEN